MEQGKRIKLTALHLSAKSMVSTLLLLFAMLMPQGAWAENYISEVKYGVNGNKDKAKGYLSGYTIIDHDFNNNTSGDWVFIGYKTSTKVADAITGLLVVTNDTESNSSTYGDSGFKSGGAKTMIVDGKRYYLAEWGGHADMNNGNNTHKNPVYLYYTKDGNTDDGAQLITTLEAHRCDKNSDGLTENPEGLNVVPLFGGNGSNTNGTYSLSKLSDFGDTNKGGGGSYNYITYTSHTHVLDGLGVCLSCKSRHVPSGLGTADSPYKVKYYTDLVYLANLIRNGNYTFHALQIDDINCWDAEIVPLGDNKYHSFKGTYDGGGHIIGRATYIRSKTSENAQFIGIFGRLTSPAKVKNLGVVYSQFSGLDAVGAICGMAEDGATIENCFALNNKIDASLGFAGICGAGSGATISNCYSDDYIRGSRSRTAITCTNCYSVKSESSVTKIDSDYIRSGYLCYHLNDGKTDGTQVWYQTIGEVYPRPKKDVSKTVYRIEKFKCNGELSGNYTYSNNKDAKIFESHKYPSDFTIDQSATCIATGSKSKYCLVCGTKGYVTSIDMLNHSMTTHAATNATCTTNGNELYYTCSQPCCSGKYYKDNGAHTTNTYANQAATVKAMLNHSMTTHAATNSTCTTNGNNLYYTCSRTCCSGKYYKDNVAHTTNTYADQAATVKAMLNHSMTAHAATNSTCTTNGNELYYTCSQACCSGKYYKDNVAHTTNTYANQAATEKAMLNHSMTTHAATDPTCIANGNYLYYTCSQSCCSYKYYKDNGSHTTNTYADQNETVVAKLPHTFANDDITQCKCTVCNHGFFRYNSPNIEEIHTEKLWDANGSNPIALYTGDLPEGWVLEFNAPLVTIGAEAFLGCSFTGIRIPNTVTTIGDNAFANCLGLDGNLIIPNSVRSIGDCAFAGIDFTSIQLYSIPQIGDGFPRAYRNNVTVVLSDNSYVYKGDNPYFPTVASVTAPCSLDLTGSAVENHANLIHTGGSKIEEKDAAHLVSSNCITDTYHYSCSKCHGNLAGTYTAAGTGSHNFTNNTLTASPVEDGLYAYACDNGCGSHTDDHIIKDFNGEGNHLELTTDGEGNYSTSENITLADANGFVSPVDFTANGVTYTRNGIKNQWGTIVVPFDVTNGDDYDFYTLSDVSGDELTLTKVEGTLTAGTPALIRFNSELVNGKTYNLTINTGETQVSNCSALEDVTPTPVAGLTLTGSYGVKEITDENGYIISNNKFWSIQDVKGENNVYCAPFRAYLSSSSPVGAKQLNIGQGKEATAIEAITAITEGEAEYYDINGHRINSLQKGVNIIRYSNGKTKKVVIK